MATVDNLQIEITASSQRAEKSIDALIQRLNSLSSTLNRVDAGKLDKATSQLSNSFGKFSLHISNIGNRTKLMSKHLESAGNSFNKTHGIIGKVTTSIKRFSTESKKAENVINRFASAVGSFYQKWFILRRGISAFWKAIKSSMDYIETLNYFNASFGQVADRAVDQWKTAGYDSADGYYNSFAKRANELTKKMSGFSLEDSGLLTATGKANLGLDPNSLMQYQAQFAQMSSSMGVASENALQLSNVLTKIGADLASVKNMEFTDVWRDMASGIVGMSRTLDKYGINIRNANMQQKLYELGINRTVASLSQADKALLRTIIILDSTKYAWGDLAMTLNAPANQLRLLTANLKNLARMLGQIFLPIVAKVLPYINALVIAVQRLLSAIASLLGIDFKGFSSRGGADNSALGDILDEADELGDSLEDDSSKAKKLKQNLLGVDELNIVSENEDSGKGKTGGLSGLLDGAFMDALEDYQLAWDKAFANLENKANEIADKIVAFAKKLFSPIAKAWENVGDKVATAWKNAFSEVGDLLKSIGSDFMEMWLQPETVKLFENLFLILADIGDVVGNLAHNFREAWESGDTGLHIFENIRDILVGITASAEEFWNYVAKIAKETNFEPLLDGVEHVTRAIADNIENIIGIFTDMRKRVVDFIQYLVEVFAPAVLEILAKTVERIDWETLRRNINDIWVAIERLAESLGGVILLALEKVSDIVVKLANGGFFEKLADDFTRFADSIEKARSIGEVFNAIFDFADGGAENIASLFNWVTDSVNNFLNTLNTIDPNTGEKPIKTLGRRLGEFATNFITNIDFASLGRAVDGLANSFLDFIIEALAKVKWEKVGEKIGDFLREIHWLRIIRKLLTIIFEVIGGIIKADLGSFLHAPIETALVNMIPMLVLSHFVTGLMKKLGIALLAGSGTLSTSFGGLFTKAISSGATSASSTSALAPISALGGSIGTALLGGLALVLGTKGGNAINKAISDANGEQAYDWKGTFADVGEFWTAWCDNLKMVIESDLEPIEKVGRFIFDGLVMGLVGWCATIASPFLTIFNWFVDGIKRIFGIASPAKNVMFLGEFIMLGIIEGFKSKIEGFGEAVALFFQKFVGWFAGIGEALDNAIGQPIKTFFADTIPQYFEGFLTTLGTWATNVITAFVEWKDGVITTVTEWATNTWTSITTWATNTVTAISEWYTNATNAFGEWFGEIALKFVHWKDEVVGTVQEWYDNVITTINTWIGETVSSLQQWYTDATNAIKNWFGETIEKFIHWKDETIRTVVEWVGETYRKIVDWVGDVIQKFEDWKREAHRKFEEWKEKVVGTFKQWYTDTVGKIKEFVRDTINAIIEWVRDTKERFEKWVGEVVKSFRQWKEETFGHIKKFAEDSFAKIKTFCEDSFKKFSGFIKDTLKNIGEWVRGMIDFFIKVKEDALAEIEKLVNGARNWFSEKNWTFSGIADGIKKAFDTALEWARSKWEGLKSWFNSLGNDGAWNYDWYEGRSYSYSYPAYANGGLVEDGFFYANHNELVGGFNGKTAVANNQQITDGIRNAVYDAFVSANANEKEVALLEELISAVREGKRLVIDGREIVDVYNNRSQRNGYSFN